MTPNENNENTTVNETEEITTPVLSENEAEAAEAAEVTDAQEDAPAELVAETDAEETEEAEVAEVAEEPEETQVVDPVSETEPAAAPKRKKGLFGFMGLFALIIVCVCLWILYSGIFAPKYAPTFDNSESTAFYIKNDAVMGRKDNGKIYTAYEDTSIESEASEGYSAAQILEGTSLRSPDGKAVFFFENFDMESLSGDLYVRYNDKEKQKIDAGVALGNLICSSDGKTATYAKYMMNESGTNTISLYLYRKGKAPQLVTENLSTVLAPMISMTAEYLAYGVADAEQQTNALYIVKTTDKKLKPIQIAANAATIHAVNDRGYVYFGVESATEDGTVVGTLYYGSKKGSVKIADNAMMRDDCFGQYTNNFAYFVTNADGSTDFFTGKIGKNPEKVFSRTSDLRFYFNPDVDNKNYIFISEKDAEGEMLDIDILYGNKNVSLAKDTSAGGLNTFANSRDFKKMTYMKDFNSETYAGTLYLSERIFGKTKTEKIAENVSFTFASEDMDYVAYMTDVDLTNGNGTLHLYDGKKSTKVAENVAYFSVSFSDKDRMLYFITDCSEDYSSCKLNVVKTNKPAKPSVIEKEMYLYPNMTFIYSARDDGSVYYVKNYNAETQTADLYFAKDGKNPELVEAGITKMILE